MIRGYFGIVIPERDFWQGYFLDDAFEQRADEMLARVRSSPELNVASTVITKLDIPDTDEPLLGSFCGTMVAASLGETEYPESVLGVCGYAAHEIIQRKFFWIEGRVEDEGGIRSSIHPIYVSTVDEARDHINSLPVVGKIKRRLLARINQGLEPRHSVGEGQHRSVPIKRWAAIDKLVADINRRN